MIDVLSPREILDEKERAVFGFLSVDRLGGKSSCADGGGCAFGDCVEGVEQGVVC